MKEKMHIAVLSLGICTLIGMTFAVSVRDYKEKEPKLNSAPESTTSSKKFVCTKEAVSENSPATKEYKKNIVKLEELLDKIDSLGGQAVSLDDPCEAMKGKARSECNINNIELKSILRQVKKLQEKIIIYEECIEKLGLLKTDKEIIGEVDVTKKSKKKEDTSTTKENNTESGKKKEVTKKIKDCGTIILDEYESVIDIDITTAPVSTSLALKCMSNAIITCSPAMLKIQGGADGKYENIVHDKESNKCIIGYSVDEGNTKCSIPLDNIASTEKSLIADKVPLEYIVGAIEFSAMLSQGELFESAIKCEFIEKKLSQWSEGEWSTCSNGKQKRTVECQSNGKKVSDTRCEGKKPATTKVCEKSDSSTNSSQINTGLECEKSCTVEGIKITPGVDYDLVDKQEIESIIFEIQEWKSIKNIHDCIGRAQILLTGARGAELRDVDRKMGQAQVNACVYYAQKMLK